MSETNFYYSKTTNLFYPHAWLGDYESAGTLPDDIVPVSDPVVAEYSCFVKEGKQRTAGADGLPTWGDIPPQPQEELIALAEQKRAALRLSADSEVSWRQGAVDEGVATEEEADALAGWKKYRVLLMRIDTSKAPSIEWPTPPVTSVS
ncbi:tail fiber assembly protein [Cedecea neteri]|uniref:tail fiber assembly protein n=1 Tax=Cedecea neteri TaxID=158822 RepID=UPI002892CFFB|nr:tail fiber assembly protein [Cedecea neteri]WNJ81700.1 tail fiber assembly protein [Cedecea neteri]